MNSCVVTMEQDIDLALFKEEMSVLTDDNNE